MPATVSTPATAVIHLGGHPPTAAHLRVTPVPPLRRAARVLAYAAAWLLSSWLTLVLTFDPFVASFPFVIGLGLLFRTLRGRYRVESFRGNCPRCAGPLDLEPGSRIPLPLSLVCYGCHHESELRIAG